MDNNPNAFYEACYEQVLKAIPKYIDQLSETQAVFLASEYEQIQGEDAIIALAGFINYAETKGVPVSDIKVTLVHDLNGRKDRHMLPRSSDYAIYAGMTAGEVAAL